MQIRWIKFSDFSSRERGEEGEEKPRNIPAAVVITTRDNASSSLARARRLLVPSNRVKYITWPRGIDKFKVSHCPWHERRKYSRAKILSSGIRMTFHRDISFPDFFHELSLRVRLCVLCNFANNINANLIVSNKRSRSGLPLSTGIKRENRARIS